MQDTKNRIFVSSLRNHICTSECYDGNHRTDDPMDIDEPEKDSFC